MNILSDKKPQGNVNPAFEEELKKVLQQVWDNRFNISQSNLDVFRRFANKKH
jgi:hypothetical protein